MKQALGLVIGLLVGAAGALLFSRSLPPPEGSPEERLEIAQRELQKAHRTIRQLEARTGRAGRSRRTVGDGVRDIMQDIREGKEVSIDDLFATVKPWMRDMAPLFDRVRQINEEDWADTMTGEWTRTYHLSASEQQALKQWFLERGRQKSREFLSVVESDSSGFVDFVRATEYNWRDTEGIDPVMEGFLEGDELARFREERLAARATSVENEANRGLTRLDEIADLDESQQAAAFAILARGADDYQEGTLAFDGMAADRSPLTPQARDQALRGLLRPDQAATFDAHLAARREKAEQDLRRLGLTLPANWDLLDHDRF